PAAAAATAASRRERRYRRSAAETLRAMSGRRAGSATARSSARAAASRLRPWRATRAPASPEMAGPAEGYKRAAAKTRRSLPLGAVRGEPGAGGSEPFRSADAKPLAVMHDRVEPARLVGLV